MHVTSSKCRTLFQILNSGCSKKSACQRISLCAYVIDRQRRVSGGSDAASVLAASVTLFPVVSIHSRVTYGVAYRASTQTHGYFKGAPMNPLARDPEGFKCNIKLVHDIRGRSIVRDPKSGGKFCSCICIPSAPARLHYTLPEPLLLTVPSIPAPHSYNTAVDHVRCYSKL
jgi:hypothetical protein